MPGPNVRIFRRPNSPFFWASYNLPDGSSVRESTKCRDRAAADLWRTTKEMELVRAAAGLGVANPVALSRAAADFLAEREKVWTPGTAKGKGWFATVQSIFLRHIVPYFGAETLVHQIPRTKVAKFQIDQLGRPSLGSKKGKKVGPATVNREMAALAAFGVWCEERGHLMASSTSPNPFTKHPKLEEPELAVADATEEQVADFLRALGVRWVAVSLLAADTGLRKGEIAKLERRHLDLDDGKATVTHTKNRKKARTVYLTPRTVEVLRKVEARPDGLVFGPIGDQRRAFRKAAAAAGLGHVRFHDLRHFFSTRFLTTGGNLRDLMAAGGWTTLRMVQRYTHVGENRLRDAAARLGAAQAALPRVLAATAAAGGAR